MHIFILCSRSTRQTAFSAPRESDPRRREFAAASVSSLWKTRRGMISVVMGFQVQALPSARQVWCIVRYYQIYMVQKGEKQVFLADTCLISPIDDLSRALRKGASQR